MGIVKNSQIVCLQVFTLNFFLVIEVTNLVKEVSHPFIIWGGAHAIASPEECAQYADIVVINEGEEALIEIIAGYKKEGKELSKKEIPNIAYKKGAIFIQNHIQRLPFLLDELPFQDYTLNRHYFVSDQNQIKPLGIEDIVKSQEGIFFNYVTIFARGCPYHCSYCLNSNSQCLPYYVGRSVDNLINELTYAKKQFGEILRSVFLYDDDFFALPLEKIREFSEKYKNAINLPIHPLNASPSSFREDKLVLLQQAGVTGIIVGIQTISENGRRSFHNNATKERIRNIVQVMQKYPDMQLIFHLILGNPFENEDDIVENLLFLHSLPKIYDLSIYQLIIYPGTKLHEMVKKHPEYEHRADEGYTLPYYYEKPELTIWNFLGRHYLANKKPLPWYVVFLLEHKQYRFLRILRINRGFIYIINYYKKYGFFTLLKKNIGFLKKSVTK